MAEELGVVSHRSGSGGLCVGPDAVFLVTGHADIDKPELPSFIAIDKRKGRLLWADNSHGENVLDGQWGTPTYAVLGGISQVLFPGGDGWLYSFDVNGTANGLGNLLWRFDCNPQNVSMDPGRPRNTKQPHYLRNGIRPIPLW